MKHIAHLNLENAPQTIILANGSFPKSTFCLQFIDEWITSDGEIKLVCCDGAINKLSHYTDKLPDYIVGDLDSITIELKEKLQDRIIYRPDQNSNDLSKAIRFTADELKQQDILILGATGEREDHTLANITLLPCFASLMDNIVVPTDLGVFYVLDQESKLATHIGQQVSIFNFEKTPITLKGVHWELEQAVLEHLFSGTLNRADKEEIYCSCPNPILIFLSKEIKELNPSTIE